MARNILRWSRFLWLLCLAGAGMATAQRQPTVSLRLQRVRHAPTDLELTGLLAGLQPGASAYASRAELLALPQVTADLLHDENFPGVAAVRVRGVRLQTLAQALGELPRANLIELRCSDGYRAQLTQQFVAEHAPILALTIDGLLPEPWAVRAHRYNPGPYFIVYAHFQPAFRVLSHQDYAQVPANVVRLNFTTTAQTFALITPPHASVAIEQGFTIAKQNCLRCHAQSGVGGTKSRYTWGDLSQVARDSPRVFTAYVRNPKSFNVDATMPANPVYDDATLAALRAYFAAIPIQPVPEERP